MINSPIKISNFKLKILLLALVLLSTPVTPAKGQGGAISPTIGVSPAKFFETVSPGKTTKYQIKLRNLSNDPIPLSASVTNVTSINEDGVPVFSKTVSKRSAASWITVDQPDVIVDVGQTRPVTFSVTPPDDVAPGGYLAAIIFQARLPSYYFDLDADTRILPAISVLTLFSIAGSGEITVDQLRIESIEVPRLVVSTPISLIARISNPSPFFVQADARVKIKRAERETADQDIGRIIILPENARKLISAFEQSVLPGFYTAEFELKQGDQVLVASAKFFALPWSFTVGMIAVVFLLFFVAFRRRFKRAWQVLCGREMHPTRPNRPTLR